MGHRPTRAEMGELMELLREGVSTDPKNAVRTQAMTEARHFSEMAATAVQAAPTVMQEGEIESKLLPLLKKAAEKVFAAYGRFMEAGGTPPDGDCSAYFGTLESHISGEADADLPFKAGDRVIGTAEQDGNDQVIEVAGTIIGVDTMGRDRDGQCALYAVEFDKPIGGHDIIGTFGAVRAGISGPCRDGHGFWMRGDRLRFEEKGKPN